MAGWAAVNAVARMQEYIQAHLNQPITLRQLAKEAGYSPWYSARIFKEHTQKAPFEYIRALRLTQAALLLRDRQNKVIDVALDFVFDSHEGFTRAFTRQFGIAPKRYSMHPEPIQLFLPYHVHGHNLTLQKGETKMTQSKQVNTVFVQVVERTKRKVILRRGVKATNYYEYCEEVGCDVWGVLTSVKEALYEPIGMWLPDHLIIDGTSQYVQGVEVPVDYSGKVPQGYNIIELPPCKMMVFQGQPYDDEIFEAAIQELWDVIKEYDPHIYGFEWADQVAPRFQLAPMGYRGYIEARAVRQINDGMKV